MASLSKTKSGARFIQFSRPDGTRPRIWLGTGIAQKEADAILIHVEALGRSRRFGTALPDGVTKWLATLPDELKRKLADVSLLDWEATETIASYAARFTDERQGRVKPTTRANVAQGIRDLTEHFGGDRPLASIDTPDAKGYVRWLENRPNRITGKTLSKDTVFRHLKTVRQFFTAARIDRVIVHNPFEGVKTASGDPSKRRKYAPVADVVRVIETAPDAYWRLIIALARFAGLRPSDAIKIPWEAVNFPEGRLVFAAPKTEHTASKGVRVIPITEDFRQYLEDVLELTGDTQFIFPEALRKKADGKNGWRGVNLNTQLRRLRERAGVPSWGKPFQNLRASYESDMAARLPLAMAAKLTGNSSMVAMRHYVDVTDATFETARAIRLVEPKASPAGQVLSVQKRERFVSETGRNGKNDTFRGSVKTLELPDSAAHRGVSQTGLIPSRGIEPLLSD